MASSQSVTEWLGRLGAGDREAAQHLWERYFGELVRLARRHMPAGRRRAADEEDVALSALDSFCRGAARGRFPDLHDRRGLWPLLVTITLRKAGKLARRENRLKHGGGAVRGGSALIPRGEPGAAAAWDEVLGAEPSPAFACQVAEECARLVARLEDPQLRQVALWKMEGYTNGEIAAKLGCVETTVERKLRVIRSVWGEEVRP
jgi:DNA-directed RNA polymerase specialized sigma24 family protein